MVVGVVETLCAYTPSSMTVPFTYQRKTVNNTPSGDSVDYWTLSREARITDLAYDDPYDHRQRQVPVSEYVGRDIPMVVKKDSAVVVWIFWGNVPGYPGTLGLDTNVSIQCIADRDGVLQVTSTSYYT